VNLTSNAQIFIIATVMLALVAFGIWNFNGSRSSSTSKLPTDWALTARPVFTTEERRIYRVLREALPHHVILSKLPLVRFCQPLNPNTVRYWYELLGSHHVTFAVCSANGRVLAAIDLEADRANSRRILQIKKSVLEACRVRYLRCPSDHLPSTSELQLLIPQNGTSARAPQAVSSPNLHQARDTLASTVAVRRAERNALWQDSTLFQDSFFAPDSRLDGFGSSEFSSFTGQATNEGDRL
jgi:hypothetical protein